MDLSPIVLKWCCRNGVSFFPECCDDADTWQRVKERFLERNWVGRSLWIIGDDYCFPERELQVRRVRVRSGWCLWGGYCGAAFVPSFSLRVFQLIDDWFSVPSMILARIAADDLPAVQKLAQLYYGPAQEMPQTGIEYLESDPDDLGIKWINPSQSSLEIEAQFQAICDEQGIRLRSHLGPERSD
jgi:hypothetical protein